MRNPLRRTRRPGDVEDPGWSSIYAAFLEQSRWLLSQEQRRSAAFQTNAVALLGFAGVVLGILVTNDFLAGEQWWSFAGVVGRLAVVLLAASALASVLALVPHGTGSVNVEDTIDAWAALHSDDESQTDQQVAEAARERPMQSFAEQILSTTARHVDRTGAPVEQNGSSPQALREAVRLADRRAEQTTWAAGLLAAGVIALMLVVVAPRPASDPLPAPTPGTSSTSPTP